MNPLIGIPVYCVLVYIVMFCILRFTSTKPENDRDAKFYGTVLLLAPISIFALLIVGIDWIFTDGATKLGYKIHKKE